MSLFLYCIYPVISIFGESIKGELSSNLEVYVVDSFNRNTINLITDFENLNSNYSFAYKNGLDFVEIVPLLFNINFVLKDFRAYVLDEYFRINQSPLYGMGEYIVEICDRYNAPRDCMILPAIAWAETNLCKSPWSASIYNCWGFGGPGENRFRYNSFYESIERVYYSLVFLYGRYYILNPREMQSTFCGRGDECTYWANNVLFAQYQINNLSISLGFPSLYSLR
ncbi:MAG: hypothetical protein NZZ41_03550 [Candidatus Dojkabacteria bacterium]|nr:hypothetical protein [Candidatus Dojkabacteria bacterium]